MLIHKLKIWAVKFCKNLFSLPAIVNPDGTRYIKKGEYRTNPEDIYPSNPTDDDVSSGSSSERSSTSGGYIFHTFSTAHPIPDEDGPWITDSTDRIPATSKENKSLCFPIAIPWQNVSDLPEHCTLTC